MKFSVSECPLNKILNVQGAKTFETPCMYEESD